MKFKYKINIAHWWRFRKGTALWPIFIDVLSFHFNYHTNGYEEWLGQIDIRILNVDIMLCREMVEK